METPKSFEFFYECRKCKAKIPARFPDNMNPVKTVQQGSAYTFECSACQTPRSES